MHTTDDTEDGQRRRRERSYRPADAVTVVRAASELSRADCPEPVVVALEGPGTVGRRRLAELRGGLAVVG